MRRGSCSIPFKGLKNVCCKTRQWVPPLWPLPTSRAQFSQWRDLNISCPPPPAPDCFCNCCKHGYCKHRYLLSLVVTAIRFYLPPLFPSAFVLLIKWASTSCLQTRTSYFLTRFWGEATISLFLVEEKADTTWSFLTQITRIDQKSPSLCPLFTHLCFNRIYWYLSMVRPTDQDTIAIEKATYYSTDPQRGSTCHTMGGAQGRTKVSHEAEGNSTVGKSLCHGFHKKEQMR